MENTQNHFPFYQVQKRKIRRKKLIELDSQKGGISFFLSRNSLSSLKEEIESNHPHHHAKIQLLLRNLIFRNILRFRSKLSQSHFRSEKDCFLILAIARVHNTTKRKDKAILY